AGDELRPSTRSDARCPTDLRIWLRHKQLAVGPVEAIEEAIAIGLDQRFYLAAAHCKVHQDGITDGVPIMSVMRRELEVPLELARVGIERNHAAGIEIIAGPHIAIHVRTGIAGAPVDEI